MIRVRVFAEWIGTGATTRVLLLAGLLVFSSVGTSAETKVTYVGLGRYSCSGTVAECAQINFNNSQVEEANSRRYQENQDRAQRYVEETRRREREYDRGRRRE